MFYFVKSFTFLFIFLFIVSCGNKDTAPIPVNNELSKMTAEERQRKAPNDAFEAVFLKDPDKVKALLQENKSLFYFSNEDGQTALMVALSLRQKDIADAIIRSLSIDELNQQDSTGRGYVSYISEQGYVDLLDLMTEKYKSKLQFYNLYTFSDIDQSDELGRTALFYASNGSIAQRLKDHYLHGFISWAISGTWWSDFYQKTDLEGNNFLHTAAQDNRYDVLQWAVKEICGDHLWEGTEFLFGLPDIVGKGVDWAVSAADAIPFIPSKIINLQNSANDSALHLAARFGNAESAIALMNCRFTEFSQTNSFGRNPLAELIATTDHHQSQIAESRVLIFDKLHLEITETWSWLNNVANYIDQQDHEGQSALHHAAKLKDPYFYNKLKVYGNIHLRDNSNQTPEGIFKSKSRQ